MKRLPGRSLYVYVNSLYGLGTRGGGEIFNGVSIKYFADGRAFWEKADPKKYFDDIKCLYCTISNGAFLMRGFMVLILRG